MKLFEIDVEIERLSEHLIDEETGEINEEVMEQLDQLQMDREKKLENIGCLIKDVKAEAEAIDAEIKALKSRRDSKMRKLESLMNYASYALNGEKLETARVAFSFRKSESVDIIDEDVIPDSLCQYKTERKPMKSDIKKLLKNGAEVPGCVLRESRNLQVK